MEYILTTTKSDLRHKTCQKSMTRVYRVQTEIRHGLPMPKQASGHAKQLRTPKI